MKRPPGIWFLLSAGVLWISLQDAYCIRATSLIFSKTTTTTSTPEASSASSSEENGTESSTEPSATSPNTTKPTLTGIPQVDYIWDPNLPKELNGYNLSSYPFYERVPEDIDFKCDGLHDGFYASVPHKCQVYHHCLFGTRYDFLCANYTAFDQKTFICHFVSEVDCVNSKKYWHRNDALYKAASTTTIKPQIIYTPPPQPNPVLNPSAAEAPLPLPPPPGKQRPFRRGGGGNRRRPQYDYYDDYEEYEYEERPRSRRKRPRPRPRPVYDDEYDEEYEDERYERRPLRRRPIERRRNKDRRKYEDEDYLPEDKVVEEEVVQDERTTDRRYNKRRPIEERRRYKPKRPIENDYEEEEETPVTEKVAVKTSSGSIYDRPRAPPIIKRPVPKTEADKYAYKPVQSVKEPETLAADEYYDDYEEIPKRKQESSESRRYTKPPSRREGNRKPSRSRPAKEEPVDDEEEVRVSNRQKPSSREEEPIRNSNRQKYNSKEENDGGAPYISRPKAPKEEEEPSRGSIKHKKEQYEDEVAPVRPQKDEAIEEPEARIPSRPKFVPKVPRPKKPTPPPAPVEEYYDDYEEQPEETIIQKSRDKILSTTTTTTTTTTPRPTTTTSTTTKEPQREIVRIVKRPFLPSRGGNPYSARGLQPVGLKAIDNKRPEPIPIEEPFKPSPAVMKVPIRAKITPNSEPEQVIESKQETEIIEHEEPKINRPRPLIFPKIKAEDYTTLTRTTTQKSKFNNRNPTDLDEYDVTLNDALNPTLPNLPVRAFPTGFSSGNDYNYNSYQRPRIILDPGLVSASSDYVYQLAKPSNRNYKQQYTVTRPRLSQVQLQNYYTTNF